MGTGSAAIIPPLVPLPRPGDPRSRRWASARGALTPAKAYRKLSGEPRGREGCSGRAGQGGARLQGLCLAYFFQSEGLSSSEEEAYILPHVAQARSNHGAREPWVEPTPRLVRCSSDRPDTWRRIC